MEILMRQSQVNGPVDILLNGLADVLDSGHEYN